MITKTCCNAQGDVKNKICSKTQVGRLLISYHVQTDFNILHEYPTMVITTLLNRKSNFDKDLKKKTGVIIY